MLRRDSSLFFRPLLAGFHFTGSHWRFQIQTLLVLCRHGREMKLLELFTIYWDCFLSWIKLVGGCFFLRSLGCPLFLFNNLQYNTDYTFQYLRERSWIEATSLFDLPTLALKESNICREVLIGKLSPPVCNFNPFFSEKRESRDRFPKKIKN